MAYRAVVERWDKRWIVYVTDLPGCQVSSTSLDVALAAAETAIPDYFKWLEKHEIRPPNRRAEELSIVEEGKAEYGVGPFFSSDLNQMSGDEFQFAQLVAASLRDDMINLFVDASPAQRNFKYSPDEESANEILRHLSEKDIWFASRMDAAIRSPNQIRLPDDPLDAFILGCIHIEERMNLIFDIARAHKFEVLGEEWSLTKVVRRRTGHVREHYPALLRAVRQRMIKKS